MAGVGEPLNMGANKDGAKGLALLQTNSWLRILVY